jgi:hypothetical protein
MAILSSNQGYSYLAWINGRPPCDFWFFYYRKYSANFFSFFSPIPGTLITSFKLDVGCSKKYCRIARAFFRDIPSMMAISSAVASWIESFLPHNIGKSFGSPSCSQGVVGNFFCRTKLPTLPPKANRETKPKILSQ